MKNDNTNKDALAELPEISRKELIRRAKKFSNKFCVTEGKGFKLKDYDPDDDGGLGPEDKPLVKQALELGVDALATLQDILYAQDKWSILLIFQAMDAAGKDGAIKHVMSGINPQGCQVSSFKTPSSEDLDHDYLWRCQKHLPERGRIGIFNRSYYEEVLVVRVHQELLARQKLPQKLVTKNIWQERLDDICNFEKYLNHNGTMVCKFFLNVSAKEQKKRFLERIDNPDKNWKFSAADAKERKYRKQYMEAYEDLIRNTATEDAPWYVVPADNKGFARVVVASAIINTLDSLDLEYPKVSDEKLAELAGIKKELLDEK
ncbi:polyphosphate kinase 2 family protein [Chitinophagaceae bacterium LB-8]|uniref:Polyphosphate kinase 2 family protein n=1 Tax=Paraflavisolibacter caeni TaxID=2982496 RepID=A0A9X2XY84_9BACT|nr:polyphosphate kinase 2 family protein [Paraflavisolibacter caeni]MCU7551779.1 polyphosphate kinase 2 family protein [Paraflavisolibacter caeni]